MPAVATLCGAGTFQPGLGMAYADDCLTCMPGKYQTGLGMTAVSDCTLCGPGTYQPYFGGVDAEACLECPSGTFQEESGGIDGYEGFWGEVDKAKIDSVSADVDALEVSYTYTFHRGPGKPTTEDVVLALTFENGTYLIDGER